MHETNIFVKFKFHFIGMQIFITINAQIVISLSHTKSTQTYTFSEHWNEIVWRYLMSNAPPWSIVWIKIVLTICTLFAKFSFSRIFDTQMAQTRLIFRSWDKIYVQGRWSLKFNIFQQFHKLLVTFHCQSHHECIFTALLSRKYNK
jgi:hypothetical protein